MSNSTEISPRPDPLAFAGTVTADIPHEIWIELIPALRFSTMTKAPVKREFVCDQIGIEHWFEVLRDPKIRTEMDALLATDGWGNDTGPANPLGIPPCLWHADPASAAAEFVDYSVGWLEANQDLMTHVDSRSKLTNMDWMTTHIERVITRLRRVALLRPDPVAALDMRIANNERSLIYAEYPFFGTLISSGITDVDAEVHQKLSKCKASVLVARFGDGDLREFYRNNTGWKVLDFELAPPVNLARGQVAARISKWAKKKGRQGFEEHPWPELYS